MASIDTVVLDKSGTFKYIVIEGQLMCALLCFNQQHMRRINLFLFLLVVCTIFINLATNSTTGETDTFVRGKYLEYHGKSLAVILIKFIVF